jgi:hypothetical protein
MKLKDWNHAHKVKEQIEKDYNVLVHILGDATFINLNCPELIKLNNHQDYIMLEEGFERLNSLEWAEKVFDLFFETMGKINNK